MTTIQENPFPGLRPFEEDEEHLFFGRDRAVIDLLARLRTSRFLAVTGVSGSGKSSLVKAGLLPALYRGVMGRTGSAWRVALFRPGDNPIGNLSQALDQAGIFWQNSKGGDEKTGAEILREGFIETTLKRSSKGLVECVRLARLPGDANLLIVVDQFEELFRFSRLERNHHNGRRDSAAFVKLLLECSNQSTQPIYTILTMRSDFLGQCAEFRDLPEAINRSLYLIPRMTREERRSAITGPVAVGGASISPTLTARLLNDVGDNPDQLPILQHALMRTWDHRPRSRRQDQPLDLNHYEAVGTMERALSRHAEEAYNQLKTRKEQAICEKLFKLLTSRGDQSRDVRRPATVGEICRVARASEREVTGVINEFRKPGRTFLMPPPVVKLQAESVIDISHESLMRIWTRLVRWVREEEKSAELYLRLARDAALNEKGKASLWRDPELMEALKWFETGKPSRGWAQRYDTQYADVSFERAMKFLTASKREQVRKAREKERQQRRKVRAARVLSAVFGILFSISIFFALSAYKNGIESGISAIYADLARDEALKAQRQADKNAEDARQSKDQMEAAKELAEKNAAAEKRQSVIALRERQEALNARLEAEERKQQAQIRGLRVRLNQEETRFRHYLAKAGELAVHSSGETRDTELKVLLAMTAYRLNAMAFKKLGSGIDDIFHQFKKVDTGNDREVAVERKNFVNTYNALLHKSAHPHQPPEIFAALREAFIARVKSKDIVYEDAEPWALAVIDDDQVIFNDRQGQLLKGTLQARKESLPVIGKGSIVNLTGGDTFQASAFTRSAEQIYCGTREGRVIRWSKGDWEHPKLLSLQSGPILAAAHWRQRDCLVYAAKNALYACDSVGKVRALARLEGEQFIRTLTVIEESGDALLIFADSRGKIFRADLAGGAGNRQKIYEDPDASPVFAIACHRDSRILALANSRGDIRLCRDVDCRSLKRGSPLRTERFERKHKGIVRALAWSSGGRYLASGGWDGVLMVWDLKREDKYDGVKIGEPVHLLTIKSTDKILSLAFAADDYLVFGDEKNLRICPTRPESFYRALCKLKQRDLRSQEWDHYIGDFLSPGELTTLCIEEK